MVRWSRARVRHVACALLFVLLAGCSSTSAPSPDRASPSVATSPPAPSHTPTPASPLPASPVPATADWPGYHANQARTGAVAAVASLGHLEHAWAVDLGGAVRGQAVVAGGHVIAATENNRVVAMDPANGAVKWSVSLGTPLTNVSQTVGCGNIDPLGVTSTPVVDARAETVYVVAEVSDGHGDVHHQLTGLSVATGAVRRSVDVDPPLPRGERTLYLLQRASLALGNGRVYVSYGGHAGDCGSYHGWVVGVAETGPVHKVSFEVAADGEGGAIWQSGGAPALDSVGNLYVSTGNANPDPPQGGPDPKAYAESVVKLSPELRPLASFKDEVAGGDADLSTGNPVLLPGGRLFAVGKTDIGFVLSQDRLSKVATIDHICGSNPDGGPAYDQVSQQMFVPCQGGGVQVVDLARSRLGSRLPGADSAPILVGNTMWALDYQRGSLTGYDTVSGARRQTIDVGAEVPIFTTPSVGSGVLLVATTRGVVAFR